MNYKTNFKFWAVCFTLTTILFSCAKKTDSTDDRAENNKSVTVRIPSTTNNISTRTSEDELFIKSAYIVVYQKGAKDDATPKFAYKVPDGGVIDGEAKNTKIVSFPKDGNIAVEDEMHIIFNKTLSNLNVSKGALIETLKLTTTTGELSGLANIADGLPMYGFGAWSSDKNSVINMTRGVAKVQLKLLYGTGVNHVAGTYGSSYSIENTTFKLYQISDVGYINGSEIASTGSKITDEIINVDEIKYPSAMIGDDFTGANYIFAYPYARKSIGSTPVEFTSNLPDMKRLAMIIKNKTAKGFVYHRLDMYDNTKKEYLDIINNNHYTIKLREVSMGGYTSASEALNSPPSNIKYDIIVEEDGEAVVSNGQYALNVNPNGNDFSSEGTRTPIEIAKVNRVTSKGAPIKNETTFSTSIESLMSVSAGAFDVSFSDTPATLGNSAKGIKVMATGKVAAAVKYNATLGNIVYESNIINLNFNNLIAGREGETLTLDVACSSGDWSLIDVSEDWLTASKIPGSSKLKVVVENNIANKRRVAKITISNNLDITLIANILQVPVEIWADYNVGVVISASELKDPVAYEAALKDHIRARNKFYRDVPAAVTACENWISDGRSDWRLPTEVEYNRLIAHPTKNYNGYITFETLFQDVHFTKTGWRQLPTTLYCRYLSSTIVSGRHSVLATDVGSTPNARMAHTTSTGMSVRCVR